MKNFILILIGTVFVILENSVLNYFHIFGVSMNILLIYISIIPLFLKKNEGAMIGLILGLLKDVLIGRILGLYGLLFFLIAYLYGILKDKIFKDNVMTMVILVGFSTLIESIVKFSFTNALFHNEKMMVFIYKGLILIPFLNILGTLVAYKALVPFLKKIEHI